MVKDGRKDGNAVKAGSEWLPAVPPVLALIAVGVLPPLLKGLYEPYVGNLVTAYVAFGMLFMVAVVGGLSLMVYRDRSALSRSTKVFRFRPDETVSDTDELAPIKVQAGQSDKE